MDETLYRLNISKYKLGSDEIKTFIIFYETMRKLNYPLEPFYSYMGNCDNQQLDKLMSLTLKLGFPVYNYREDWDYPVSTLDRKLKHYDIRNYTEFEYTLLLHSGTSDYVKEYKTYSTPELDSIILEQIKIARHSKHEFSLGTLLKALTLNIPLNIALQYVTQLGITDNRAVHLLSEFNAIFGHYPTPNEIKLITMLKNTRHYGKFDGSVEDRGLLFLTLIPDYVMVAKELQGDYDSTRVLRKLYGLMESAYYSQTLHLLPNIISNLHNYLAQTIHKPSFLRDLLTANSQGDALPYLNMGLDLPELEHILAEMSNGVDYTDLKLFTLI